MIDDQIILNAERLRDNVAELKTAIQTRYKKKTRQVVADEVRLQAATLAQQWLVELAPLDEVRANISEEIIADTNVHFQRILTFSERATTRSKYDTELRSILRDYAIKIVVPLKQARNPTAKQNSNVAKPQVSVLTAFIGQSFSTSDAQINEFVSELLKGLGLSVVTGEKPRSQKISDKVKTLIERQSIFVGIFTRRDKIARKREWTTSAWVIDEKAYALGHQKPLILIKEQGVDSIGGIQGDYEYVEFSRDQLGSLAIELIGLFDIQNQGLSKN